MSAGSPSVVVIDAGTGNLRSVEKALAAVGARPEVTRDPEVVRRAPRVVVPGQGAFGDFMSGLRARGLEQPLREIIADGRPYLGICLGLQVLYEHSEEHGPVDGLGILRGQVVRFRPADRALKVPHMGWNQVHTRRPDEPLLAGIADGAEFYFVHSYHVAPADPATVALTCDYGGDFCAAVRWQNLFACQFHPEKSAALGLRLLANFAGVA
ncbi:MAG TPA: imidazole glycerol phosphate synthase subunit HisH [Kofleriaceae bacterium]|nr:imidazole glycerol phosphate synthase subunit HisH [Kofleriaceae bacterium]